MFKESTCDEEWCVGGVAFHAAVVMSLKDLRML